jgi:hypothetical protein
MARIHINLLAVVLLSITLLIFGYVAFPVEDDDTGSSSVTVYIDFGDQGQLHRSNHTIWESGTFVSSEPTTNDSTMFEFRNVLGENQTVFALLTSVSDWGNFTIEFSDYSSQDGKFIDAIAGVENQEASWEYSINGEYGVKACDLRKVADGDIIIWKYS